MLWQLGPSESYRNGKLVTHRTGSFLVHLQLGPELNIHVLILSKDYSILLNISYKRPCTQFASLRTYTHMSMHTHVHTHAHQSEIYLGTLGLSLVRNGQWCKWQSTAHWRLAVGVCPLAFSRWGFSLRMPLLVSLLCFSSHP